VQLILAKISIKFATFHSSDGNSMNYFNYTMSKIDILIELNAKTQKLSLVKI
jgi:hypothetical protein